jgi:hypothetical protein
VLFHSPFNLAWNQVPASAAIHFVRREFERADLIRASQRTKKRVFWRTAALDQNMGLLTVK